MDRRAELQPHIEATAHKPCQQGDGDAFREIEVLHRRLFLLFAQALRLHVARHADDGNAHKRHHYTDNDRSRQLLQMMRLGIEDVQYHRSQNGAQTGARAQRDALSQRHAKVAHRKPESQSAHAPQHTEKDGHCHIQPACTGKQLKKAVSRRNSQQRTQQRENQPGKHALNQPVRLPAPVFYPINRHVTARLAERADSNNQ